MQPKQSLTCSREGVCELTSTVLYRRLTWLSTNSRTNSAVCHRFSGPPSCSPAIGSNGTFNEPAHCRSQRPCRRLLHSASGAKSLVFRSLCRPRFATALRCHAANGTLSRGIWTFPLKRSAWSVDVYRRTGKSTALRGADGTTAAFVGQCGDGPVPLPRSQIRDLALGFGWDARAGGGRYYREICREEALAAQAMQRRRWKRHSLLDAEGGFMG